MVWIVAGGKHRSLLIQLGNRLEIKHAYKSVSQSFQGGIGEEGDISNVALTAYVVTSLIEGGVVISAKVLKDSLSCLRALPPPKAMGLNR